MNNDRIMFVNCTILNYYYYYFNLHYYNIIVQTTQCKIIFICLNKYLIYLICFYMLFNSIKDTQLKSNYEKNVISIRQVDYSIITYNIILF